MKKVLCAISALLLIAALFCGCQSKSTTFDNAAGGTTVDSPQKGEIAGTADEEIGTGNSAASDRKMVRTGTMELETREYDKAVDEITALASSLGGYLQSTEISGKSYFSGGTYLRRATFVLKIPAERFSEAKTQLSSFCNVISQSENAQDITDTYYDTESRLASLKIQEERLLAMLQKAEKLEDMLTIETSLADVRSEIASLSSQIARYDNQVAYATVTVNLSEVAEYTDTEDPTFGQKIAGAFSSAMEFVGKFGEGILLVLVSAGPFILIYGGAAFLITLLIIKLVRRYRKHHPKPPKPVYQPCVPYPVYPQPMVTQQPPVEPDHKI